MKIVFVTGFVSPHIIPMCDALYDMCGDRFSVVETQKVTPERERMGYGSYSNRSYVKRYCGDASKRDFLKSASKFDLMIFSLGSADYSWVEERVRADKLTILMSERLFKRGFLKLLDPKLWAQVARNLSCRNRKNIFLFTMGAYTAQDFIMTGFPRDKIRKFGYFPSLDSLNFDELIARKSRDSVVRIVWIGRLINWKRPLDVVKLASALSKECVGVSWELDIIGDGPFYSAIGALIDKMRLFKKVNLRGKLLESEIEEVLRACDIFISTSSKREGWGAVINEAMSRGCAVIATEEGGGAKELIRNDINGMLFKSGDIKYLTSITRELIINKKMRAALAEEAHQTIFGCWNSVEAALRLRQGATNGFRLVYKDGPLSE